MDFNLHREKMSSANRKVLVCRVLVIVLCVPCGGRTVLVCVFCFSVSVSYSRALFC